jgi:hypothetical protein
MHTTDPRDTVNPDGTLGDRESTKHLYDIEHYDTAHACRRIVKVFANTRNSAVVTARRHGFEALSVNMIG